MTLLGVPGGQIGQMQDSGVERLSSFVQHRLDQLFTKVPIRTNYFWRVYIQGHSTGCCPPYLRRENFKLLREHATCVHLHTKKLSDCLGSTNDRFSVYVLLDQS